eukprot:6440195-Prymnesium_polylepis.1
MFSRLRRDQPPAEHHPGIRRFRAFSPPQTPVAKNQTITCDAGFKRDLTYKRDRWVRASGTRCTDRRYDVEGC